MKGDAAASGQTLAKSLGIEVRDLTAEERKALGIGENFPAIIINSVEANSQGARRFRAGDLIHGINRDKIISVESFYEMLGELPADQSAVLILSRRGQRYQVLLQPAG
jgi:S1-C subfamily serine protease